jgi:hypothetical protein
MPTSLKKNGLVNKEKLIELFPLKCPNIFILEKLEEDPETVDDLK